MDRGTWWATVHRVTKRQTGVKCYIACCVHTNDACILQPFYGVFLWELMWLDSTVLKRRHFFQGIIWIHSPSNIQVQNTICGWRTMWRGDAGMVQKGLQSTCAGPLVANWWEFSRHVHKYCRNAEKHCRDGRKFWIVTIRHKQQSGGSGFGRSKQLSDYLFVKKTF